VLWSALLPCSCMLCFYCILSDVLSKSTHDIFNKMCIPSHCLLYLLPVHHVSDNLRLRGHGFQLPTHSTVLHSNSFVTRSLFLYVWVLTCVCLVIFNKRLLKGCSINIRRFELLPRLCRVRCYSFDPSVLSICAVSGRPIATVIVHTMVLDNYCVLTSWRQLTVLCCLNKYTALICCILKIYTLIP